MADYPTLPTKYGSDPDPISAITIDRAEDGTGRARSFYTTDKAKLSVTHEWLSAAQKSTLDSFYNSNRLTDFTYTSPTDGVVRTCIFAAQPKYERKFGDYWTATVKMEEV